jgi:hypothetical protein
MIIAAVIDWLDDDQTVPADFVQVVGQGFEAIVLVELPGPEPQKAFDVISFDQYSLGLFSTCNAAIHAIHVYRDREDKLFFWNPGLGRKPS